MRRSWEAPHRATSRRLRRTPRRTDGAEGWTPTPKRTITCTTLIPNGTARWVQVFALALSPSSTPLMPPSDAPLTRPERPRRIHLHPSRVLQRRMPVLPAHLPHHALCRLPHHLALHLRHALDERRVQPRRHQLDRAGPADLKLPVGGGPRHAQLGVHPDGL